MKALLFGKQSLAGARKNARGVATLEILIAFTILMLSLSAVILVVFSNQSISVDTQTNQEAVYKAQAQIEQARSLSYQDFNSVVSVAPAQDDIYQKSVTVDSVDAYTKKVTSTVSWNLLGRSLSVNLVTLLTNPTVGNSCYASLSGDWTAPSMRSYEFGKDLLVPSDSSSGYPITSVQAMGNKLYVTVNNTHGNNNPTLFAFDISDITQKPQFLWGVDNSQAVGEGLQAAAIFGHYAYTANAYTGSSASCTVAANCAQLQIIDLDNRAAQTNVKIPATTSGNKLANGTSIFYSKGYVYVGLAKASGSGSEFYIIDVGGGGSLASPTNPLVRGSYAVGNGVNSIFVKDTYAYVASPNAENITILDVSNPMSPTRVGGYTPAGSSNGKSVYMKEGVIYFGRTYGNNGEFYMLNSPSGSLIKFKDIGSGNGTSINGLLIRESLAFLITGEQFEVWDTSGSISQYATPLTLPGGSGTSLGCKGNYIYVGSLPSNEKGFISIVGPAGSFAPTSFDYTLGNSGNLTIKKNNSGSNTITRVLVSGASVPVTLSVSGLPSKTSGSFAPASCGPTCASTFTVNVQNSAAVGVYPITITGSPAGVGPRTTSFTLTITN